MISLLAAHARAVREGDPDRRQLLTGPRGIGEGRPEVEEPRPLPRVLGAGDLSVRRVDQGIGTIPEQSALRDVGGVQLFAQHGLHRVPA